VCAVKIHRDSTDLEAQTNRYGVFEDPSNLHGAFDHPKSRHGGAFVDPRNQHGAFVGQFEVQSADLHGCSSTENLCACGKETEGDKEGERDIESDSDRDKGGESDVGKDR